jgi:O-antigen/teichoic acid export membrane protein
MGNIVYAAMQWSKLIILAKLGTTEMVGQFTLGLAFGAPVVILSNLGLRSIQATDHNAEFDFSDYLGLRIITSLLALFIISIFGLFFVNNVETAIIIVIVGLGKALDAVSEIYQAFFQLHERMDRVSISLILRSILSSIVMALILSIAKNFLLAIFISSLVSLIILFLYDIPNMSLFAARKSFNNQNENVIAPVWKKNILIQLIPMSFPLGLSAMLVSLNTNIPRYFLEHFSGERELGIYGALAYLIVAGSMVVNALGQTSVPKLAKLYQMHDLKGFIGLLLKLLMLVTLLGVAGIFVSIVAGEQILAIIYNSEYSKYSNVLVLLMISGLIMYLASILNYAVNACWSFKVQPIVMFLVSLSSLLACMLLIPSMRIVGATWSVIVTWSMQCILLTGLLIFLIKKNGNTKPRCSYE